MTRFFLKLTIAATSAVMLSGAAADPLTHNTGKTAPSVTPSRTLHLYGGAYTRSAMIEWYLAELAVPYEYQELDIRAGDHLKPEYLAINPMGKLPAIVDGEFKLWESGAILLYLADKYDQMGGGDRQKQAEIIQWVLFANATLGPGLFLEDRRQKEMPRLLQPLNQIFHGTSFLIGSELTVADVAVGYYLYMARLLLKLDYSEYPAVVAYLDNLSKRPAFQTTVGQR